jgi:hypothetical protein
MSEWLDTEAKAILQRTPPEKLAPADTAGYTLVLLSKTSDQERLRQALAKVPCCDPAASNAIFASPCPHVVATGLTAEDAMFGQFELACCDCAAVFVRDEVIAEDDRSYLSRLYAELSDSEEFRPVGIEIHAVPNDERGRRFMRQFVGTDLTFLQRVALALHETVMEKKARMMWHWGRKIGADVRMAGPQGGPLG